MSFTRTIGPAVRVHGTQILGSAPDSGFGGRRKDNPNLGGVNSQVLPATETQQGKIELATQAETDAGVDDLRAITPLKLQTTIVNYARRLVERVYFQGAVVKGDPVYVSGVNGAFIQVNKAMANSASTLPGVGVAAADQAGGSTGLIIRHGILDGLNTGSFTIGTALYIGPTGGLTSTRPAAPFAQRAAVVLRSGGGDGVIGVNFAEVEEMNRTLDKASQAETDAGLEDSKYVSPLKLKTTTFLSSKIIVDRLGASTYSTLQHHINTMSSPGLISGGEITVLSATQVRVAAGRGMIRVADDNVSSLPFFDWAQTDFTVPADDTVRFFGVVYNAGTPVVEMRTAESWDKDTEFALGTALHISSNGILVLTNPYKTGDAITNIIQRFDANAPVLRDSYVGGLIIANVGTRNISISGGTLWHRLNDNAFAAFDSSGASRFTTVYYNGTSWVFTSGVAQWPNAQYNNVATGLAAMTGARYANLWFYVGATGNNVFMVYGQAQHVLLADAFAEGEPTFFPTSTRPFVVLVGKLTFQNGGATPTQLLSPFTSQSLGFGSVNTHNDLSGLQGGAAGEYYHLTLAAYDNISAGTTAAPRFARASLGNAITSDTQVSLHLNKGIRMESIDSGPDFGADFGVHAYRTTNECVPEAFLWRGAGYIFENSSAVWLMTLTSDGMNVGAPASFDLTKTIKSKLEVYGGASIGSLYSRVTAAPADGLLVQGQCLFGKSTPTGSISGSKLEVGGIGLFEGALYGTGGPATAPATSGSTPNHSFRVGAAAVTNLVMDMGVLPSGGGFWLQGRNAADYSLSYPVILNPNGGNVGIGTTSPGSKLHVAGPIRFQDYSVAALPSAAMHPYAIVFVNNSSNVWADRGIPPTGGGAEIRPVMSDGSQWLLI